MLYIILSDFFAHPVGADQIAGQLGEQFPEFGFEWYWDDADAFEPTEYGVKVRIHPDDHRISQVMAEAAKLDADATFETSA